MTLGLWETDCCCKATNPKKSTASNVTCASVRAGTQKYTTSERYEDRLWPMWPFSSSKAASNARKANSKTLLHHRLHYAGKWYLLGRNKNGLFWITGGGINPCVKSELFFYDTGMGRIILFSKCSDKMSQWQNAVRMPELLMITYW